MPDLATPPLRFAVAVSLPVEADFLGASDLRRRPPLAVAEADGALGLCAALADKVPQWLRRPDRFVNNPG